MSAYFSALCSLILFKQFLLIRQQINKHFLVEMPKFALAACSMYKLLNIFRKIEFMNSNLLQCNTLVAVLLLAAEM